MPPSSIKTFTIHSTKQDRSKFLILNTSQASSVCGFTAIAGMHKLKDTLYHEVVMPLRDKPLYDKYKLTTPNGMLMYGPPGCGKTFIANRLAEEISFNFVSVKPSDLACTYVHGAQKKIGELFKAARENAPTIIFFDEIDALVPNREGGSNLHYSMEVNEFLAQMTDCSKDQLFVIGATNRPDRIDPAMLRTGRFDKVVYISPPDYEARIDMFRIHLDGRPISDIDYARLAESTENYVASDIKYIVDEAARIAIKKKEPIRLAHILTAICDNKPSVSIDIINNYKKFENSRTFD